MVKEGSEQIQVIDLEGQIGQGFDEPSKLGGLVSHPHTHQ
jgi:hypothetical protein